MPDELKFTENEINLIKDLFEKIVLLKKEIPFRKIFQYFKKNILYTPQIIDFNTDFLNIYKEYKKKIINAEWNDYFIYLGEQNLRKSLQMLFKDYDYSTLDYFTPELKRSINHKSAVKIKNIEKLNLLIKFLDEKYSQEVDKLLNRILINGSFTKDSYRGTLSNIYYTLHNYQEKIRNLDFSLEPESEIGKKLSTLTMTFYAENESTKVFQQIIKDLNSKSEKLAENAFNALWNLSVFLNNLINTNITANVILLNLNELKAPGYHDLKSAVLKVKELFESFFKVYNNLPE